MRERGYGKGRNTKDTPIIRIKPVSQEKKIRTILRIPVINRAEDEHSNQPAQTANYDLESTPPVAATVQAYDENGDGTGAEEIRDEVDLQHARALERDDDDGEDQQHDRGPDPP